MAKKTTKKQKLSPLAIRVILIAAALLATFIVGTLLLALASREPAPTILGLALAVLLSFAVGPLVDVACAAYHLEPPKSEDGKFPIDLLGPESSKRGPLLLGLFETVLFYGALCADAPVAIAGWLGFKAASKWAAWQHVMKLPHTIEGIEEISYVRFRHALASVRLTAFLMGTIGNLVAALAGLAFRAWLR